MRRSYKDKEFCLMKVKEDGTNYDKVAEELKEDRDIILAAVENDREYYWQSVYKSLPEKYRGDKEITIAAVKIDGRMLEYATDEMKADREVVGYAVEQDGWALRRASEELRNDKELIIRAVSNGGSYDKLSEEQKKDREIAMAFVTRYGDGLRYVPEELRKDREIVLAAMKSSHYAWDAMPEEFEHDKEIALEYVRNGGKYELPEELKGDYDIVMEWAKQGEDWCLQCADGKWNNDREIVMTCVSKNGKAYEYASKRLKADLEVAITAAKTAPVSVMIHAPEELKRNKCFVRYLVEQDPDALVDAPEEYKHDPEIMAAALKHIDTERRIGYWDMPSWMRQLSLRDIQAALNCLDKQGQKEEKECA